MLVTAWPGSIWKQHLASSVATRDPILTDVVQPNGETGDDQLDANGPDSNYSYTSFSYIYEYRILAADGWIRSCSSHHAMVRRIQHGCRRVDTVPGEHTKGVCRSLLTQDLLPGLELLPQRSLPCDLRKA